MPDINGIPYVESSDLVSAYPAASQALAQEISDQLAEKLPYSYGTATPSTSDNGFLWYDSNSTPPEVKFWDGAAFQALTSGKILQVLQTVKTDVFTTSSGTFVDVTGLSVSITPQSTSSTVFVMSSFVHGGSSGGTTGEFQLVRNSTNIAVATGGTTNQTVASFPGGGQSSGHSIMFIDSPATTSATTYKLQIRDASSGTNYVGRSAASDRRGISTITVMEIAS